MTCLVDLEKSVKKWFTGLLFQGFIHNAKQRVAEGEVIKLHTLRIQMPQFSDRSSDYFQDVTCFCFVFLLIHKKEDDFTCVCYFHIIHIYEQIIKHIK